MVVSALKFRASTHSISDIAATNISRLRKAVSAPSEIHSRTTTDKRRLYPELVMPTDRSSIHPLQLITEQPVLIVGDFSAINQMWGYKYNGR